MIDYTVQTVKTDNFENRISKAKESSISYLKEVVNYAETI